MGGLVQRTLLDTERSGYPRECRMTAFGSMARARPAPDIAGSKRIVLLATILGFECGVPGRHAGERRTSGDSR